MRESEAKSTVVIKTNYQKLNELAKQLERLEADLADVTNLVTKQAKSTARTVKARNREVAVRRACDNVVQAADTVIRQTRGVCDKLDGQSRTIKKAVNSYKENDSINKVNTKSCVNMVGNNLGGLFNFMNFSDFISSISVTIYRFL